MRGISEPGRRAGRTWAATVLAGLVWSGGATAQEPAPADEKAQPTAPVDTPREPELPVDPVIWPEPRRGELLRNEFPELPATVMSDRDRNALVARINEMAQGRGFDRTDIKRYVDYNAGELTRRANIAAMMDAEGAGKNPRALDEAANRLLTPLIEAPATNQSFRREYIARLLDHDEALLSGHLLTRSFFMVVLSRAGAPELIPVLVAQLEDPGQTYTVKLLAAVGLTNIADHGRRTLDSNTQALPAARALADFLRNAPDAPPPVQVRCLEAMGSLRQATANPLSGEAELAAVAFDMLASDQLEPMVRAWAGRALSRLIYPSQVRELNFDVVAYELGRAALAAGERIASIPIPADAPAKNLRLASRGTEALLRTLEAFVGDDQIRGTGLDSLGGSTLVRGIEQRVRALATAAFQFGQSAGAQVRPAQLSVDAAVQELRSYLTQNPPKNPTFYAGGPSIETPATPAPARAAGVR